LPTYVWRFSSRRCCGILFRERTETIVIPLLIAVLFGSRAKAAALSAIAAGVVVTAVWIIFLQESTGLDGLVVGAAANLLVFAVVALVTRSSTPTTPATGRPVAEEA